MVKRRRGVFHLVVGCFMLARSVVLYLTPQQAVSSLEAYANGTLTEETRENIVAGTHVGTHPRSHSGESHPPTEAKHAKEFSLFIALLYST